MSNFGAVSDISGGLYSRSGAPLSVALLSYRPSTRAAFSVKGQAAWEWAVYKICLGRSTVPYLGNLQPMGSWSVPWPLGSRA